MNKKQGFLKRNKERFKVGGAIGLSFGTIGAVSALIIAHLANPALGIVTIPILFQTILTIVIKKAPKNLDQLKIIISDIMKDAPDDLKEKFIDEVASEYSSKMNSSRTAQDTEPIQTPSETEETTLPARYHKRTNTYEVFTPRYKK